MFWCIIWGFWFGVFVWSLCFGVFVGGLCFGVYIYGVFVWYMYRVFEIRSNNTRTNIQERKSEGHVNVKCETRIVLLVLSLKFRYQYAKISVRQTNY